MQNGAQRDDPVGAAEFLVATRVQHEANQRVAARRAGGDSPPRVDVDASEPDVDEQLRAAALVVESRSRHEANERLSRATASGDATSSA